MTEEMMLAAERASELIDSVDIEVWKETTLAEIKEKHKARYGKRLWNIGSR